MKIDKNTNLISDTHLGHENILKHCKTRLLNMKFKKYTNHDKWIKDNWNSVIKDDDSLIHLGDLSYKGKHEVISGLNGKKYLLKGNHDDLKSYHYEENNFELIYQMILIDEFKNDKVFLEKINKLKNLRYFNFILVDIEGIRILLSHFPIVDTMGYDTKYKEQIDGLNWIFEYTKCKYNIHGHTHENTMKDNRCINVSMERTRFKPIKIKELILELNGK